MQVRLGTKQTRSGAISAGPDVKGRVVEVIELEAYSQDNNLGIVRMPGRRYPGSVVQGDTLRRLAGDARYIRDNMGKPNSDADELADAATDLCNLLQQRLQHYEVVLKEHGIALPY